MPHTFTGKEIRAVFDRIVELETQLATLTAEVRNLAADVTTMHQMHHDPPAPIRSFARENHNAISVVPPELFLG